MMFHTGRGGLELRRSVLILAELPLGLHGHRDP